MNNIGKPVGGSVGATARKGNFKSQKGMKADHTGNNADGSMKNGSGKIAPMSKSLKNVTTPGGNGGQVGGPRGNGSR